MIGRFFPLSHQGSPLINFSDQIRSDQLLSRVRLFVTPWIAARQASLSITNSRSSPSHLILCHPLLLLPTIPPSIRVFSNESTLGMRWPKYWSFSFSIIPSKEIPGLISFRMDWLDLLAVQVTLKRLLQHHSSKSAGGRYGKKSRGGRAYKGAQGVASKLDGELGDGVVTKVNRRECIKIEVSTSSQRLAGE